MSQCVTTILVKYRGICTRTTPIDRSLRWLQTTDGQDGHHHSSAIHGISRRLFRPPFGAREVVKQSIGQEGPLQ